jgi:RNA polymerase-binding transcription factor DksA
MAHDLEVPEGSGAKTEGAPEASTDPMKALMKSRVCGKSRQTWIKLVDGLTIRSEAQLLEQRTTRAKLLNHDGQFGMCEADDVARHRITTERLLANPTARLCIQCQIKAEKLAVPSGGPVRRRTR